jgi:hypothetical protein
MIQRWSRPTKRFKTGRGDVGLRNVSERCYYGRTSRSIGNCQQKQAVVFGNKTRKNSTRKLKSPNLRLVRRRPLARLLSFHGPLYIPHMRNKWVLIHQLTVPLFRVSTESARVRTYIRDEYYYRGLRYALADTREAKERLGVIPFTSGTSGLSPVLLQ